MRQALAVFALFTTAALSAERTSWAQPLPLTTPESQGMSSARLERLHAMIRQHVDEGKHAGAVWLIARNGRIVDWGSHGYRDIEARLPMEKDTIVRIYSMSKIVTSVAVLMLHEEARFKLDDPIGDYLPELARMKVMTGGTADAPLLADAKTPITIKHLLTHTSGFTYHGEDTAIGGIYMKADLWESPSLSELIRRVAMLPLAHEPGERFTYGLSTDVLGALVEKVSGQPFAAFVETRICRPLGMKDTTYDVAESKRGRLAKTYEHGPDEKLREAKPKSGAYAEPGRGLRPAEVECSRPPATTHGSCRCFSTAAVWTAFNCWEGRRSS